MADLKRLLNKAHLLNGGGLLELPDDDRDFDLGAVFGFDEEMLGGLPKEFIVPILYYHDQRGSDMCTGFSTAQSSEDQEGLPLHPEFQFMIGKLTAWGWKNHRQAIARWGNNMRDAVKGAVKYGSVPLKDYPEFVLGKRSRDFLTNWNNWPKEVWDEAKKYKKDSYFKVKPGKGLDMFDSLRLAIWNNKELKRTIVVGAKWRGTWNNPSGGVIPKSYSSRGTGHMFEIIGFKEIDGKDYLVIYFNYGKRKGDEGKLYFSRNVANREFYYGAYSFIDMPLSVAKVLNQYSGKVIGEGKPPLFYVIGGKKRHITNLNFLNALGFEDKRGSGGFEIISPQELALIPDGDPIKLGDLKVNLQQLFNRNSELAK